MTNEDRAPTTVAELLDLPAEPDLYASTYAIGSEPTSRPPPGPAHRAKRVSAETLDRFLPEVRAGASDASVARATGATRSQVGRWRRANEVARPRGRPNIVTRATSVAVELLGHPFEPVLAEVRTSRLRGRFEPPEYVLRDGLDYELMVQFIEVLATTGFTDDDIALGLGLRPKDVLIARVLTESGT